MTPQSFREWRRQMGFSQQKAAEALGLSKSAIEQYELGRRKGSSDPVTIPRTVALACRALFHNLEPMP